MSKILVFLFIANNLFAYSYPDFIKSVKQSLVKMENAKSLASFKEAMHRMESEFDKHKHPLTDEQCISFVETLSVTEVANFSLSNDEHILIGPKCLAHLTKINDRYYYNQTMALDFARFESDFSMHSKSFETSHLPKLKPVNPPSNFPSLNTEKPVPYQKGPVYFNADLPKGILALTYDDGPKPSTTSKILEILEEEGVKVTFFGVGKNIRKYSDIVRKAHDAGHSFGHHSNDHANLPKLSYLKGVRNIDDGRKAVSDVLNYDYPLFRFPYGSRNKKLQAWVKDQEMATFFWNIDTLDWKIKDPKELYKYTVNLINKQQRGIVLFHDIHKQTEIVTRPLIRDLKRAGYRFVVFVK